MPPGGAWAVLCRLRRLEEVLDALGVSAADHRAWQQAGCGWPVLTRPDGVELVDPEEVLAVLRRPVSGVAA